jgi:GT2 family glycosyltransferase
MSKRNRKPQNIKPKTASISTPKDLVSIIIAVYGRFDLLAQCLDAIPEAAGDLPYNVVLVDNNSPEKDVADSFYQSVQQNTNNVFVIRNKENMGFPYACNQGSKRRFSPLLYFLNSDVVLKKDAIVNLVKALDNPKIGIVGTKLLFPDNSLDLKHEFRPAGKVQHVGLCTNIRGDFYHVFVGWSPDHPKVMKVWEVYAVTGAALMTRRALFDKVGGFYLGYGLGSFEDVDLSLSIRELGYNVIVEQSAVGIHYTGATAEHYKMPYPLDQNRLIFMSRWASRINYTEINHL